MSSERRRLTALAVATIVAAAAALSGRAAAPRFYADDPIQVDDDRALDASGARRIEGSNVFDFAEQTFFKPGDRRPSRRPTSTRSAGADSTWFTGRLGRREMSVEELVRGPNELEALDVDGWPIVEGKSSGITPGYRVADPSGRLYQIKFDPPGNPEMGSGAEVIGAAMYHALGYNVVQGYIVEIDPGRIVISPEATTVVMGGRRADAAQAWTASSPAPRRTENTARLPAVTPMGPRSATSSTTAPAPTTPTTFILTSIAASSGETVCSRHGSTMTTRAASTRSTCSRDPRGAGSCGITCSTSGRSWAAAARGRRCLAPAMSTSSNGNRRC
jgi:hypothetical protein